MSTKKILFTRHNDTNYSYLEYLSYKTSVIICHNRREPPLVSQKMKSVLVTYQPWFFGKVINFFNLHRMYPQYISHLQKLCIEFSVTDIVTPDLYDFILLQSVRYKKKRNGVKLYVWSETRNWPRFWLSRWVMYVFWWYFKLNAKYIEKVFVFTKEGKYFFNTHAPEVDVVVLPAPIDTKLFYSDAHKKYLPDGVLRIIMNARFIPLKEHRTLFKTLKELSRSGIAYQVSLIGKGGHLKNELQKYAIYLGIADNITWLEAVALEELREIYFRHDVLVLPSNREAIGMVVPEAMACGLATVTSKAVGANTYVKEGETGFIFETGDVDDLAEKLIHLTNVTVLQQMGINAAETIKNNYTKEILGKKLQDSLM